MKLRPLINTTKDFKQTVFVLSNLLILFSFFIFSSCRSLGGVGNAFVRASIDATSYNRRSSYARTNNNSVSTSDKQTDFSLLLGRFVHREGILHDLGETEPSFGFHAKFLDNNKDKVQSGGYIMFAFDHFLDTDWTLLQPKFENENYTNYLWSVGWAFQKKISALELNYNVGPGINFIEIDTARTNPNLTDAEATDITFSIIQKASITLNTNRNASESTLFGLSMLWYWMPSPLGEFANDNLDVKTTSGSSVALYFEIIFRSH